MGKRYDDWLKLKQQKEQEAKDKAVKLVADMKQWSNNQLWPFFIAAQMPDDYDGCFTDSGDLTRKATLAEVEERLYAAGFLQR